jgi:hypothetical protein
LLPLLLLLLPSEGKLPKIVTGGAAGRDTGRKAALPTGTNENLPPLLVADEAAAGRPCDDDVPAAALKDANDVAGRFAKAAADDEEEDDDDDDEDDDDEYDDEEKEENVLDIACGRAAAAATGLPCISTSR